jgi:hypothetical protein
MSYQLTPTTNILRLADNAMIPADPGNADYQAYLAWQGAGNTPAPIPGIPVATLIANAQAQVRSMRVNAFATLAGMQSQALATGDTATAVAISGLQNSLKALPDISVTGLTTQAQIDAAFAAGWQAIVAAAPANVVSAFNGLQP